MSVFRVEKTKDYTVMSNHHLRNSELSLRAKGLLSQILSLPDGWDYTIAGLAKINKEGKDAVRAAVQELEKAGYIERRQKMDAGGKFSSNEYVVYESPRSVSPLSDFPTTVSPTTEKPSTEEPSTGKPLTENPTELNKEELSKDKYKKKSKKEKVRSKEPELLTDEQLWQTVRSHIAAQHSWGSWPRETKNQVHKLILEVYDPGRAVRKSHPMRTERSVDLLFTNLHKRGGSDPDAIIGLLSDVIQNGWQNVSAPKGKASAPTAAPPREERQYQCI